MKSARLGLLALSACSIFLLGCPTAVDMHKEIDGGSSTGSGGKTGSGGSSGGSNGGSTGTGGSSSTGGSSGSGAGGSSSTGGSSGSGAGGRGGATGSGGRTGSGGARADAGMEAGGAAVSFKTDIAPLMVTAKCTMCHAMSAAATGAEWLGANAAAGRPCANRKRGDVVLSKVDPTMTPACGAKMPLPAGTAQNAELAAKLKTWLAAGAPNN